MAEFQEVVIAQEPTGPEAPAQTPPEETKEGIETPPEGATEGTETPPEETTEGTEETAEKSPEEKAADEAAEAAGIDIPAVEAHFLETGEIPADTYEKAAKIGLSKEIVDEFVQYRVGQADRIRAEMLQPFGGEEVVGSMVEWAGKNWTADQAKSFNDAIASADRGRVDLALKALKADYDKKNGVKPNLVKPTNSKTVPGGVYESTAQLHADQADPRYRTDPAFRDSVIAKLARSKI